VQLSLKITLELLFPATTPWALTGDWREEETVTSPEAEEFPVEMGLHPSHPCDVIKEWQWSFFREEEVGSIEKLKAEKEKVGGRAVAEIAPLVKRQGTRGLMRRRRRHCDEKILFCSRDNYNFKENV
jgi:hypothetical protein